MGLPLRKHLSMAFTLHIFPSPRCTFAHACCSALNGIQTNRGACGFRCGWMVKQNPRLGLSLSTKWGLCFYNIYIAFLAIVRGFHGCHILSFWDLLLCLYEYPSCIKLCLPRNETATLKDYTTTVIKCRFVCIDYLNSVSRLSLRYSSNWVKCRGGRQVTWISQSMAFHQTC